MWHQKLASENVSYLGTCGTKLPSCTTLRLAARFIFDARHHLWYLNQAMQALTASQLQDQKANPESSGVRMQIIITLDFICSGDFLPGINEKHGSKCVLGALGRWQVCSSGQNVASSVSNIVTRQLYSGISLVGLLLLTCSSQGLLCCI